MASPRSQKTDFLDKSSINIDILVVFFLTKPYCIILKGSNGR